MEPAAYIAFTSSINPTGASPVLSRAQVWKALERKIRHAEEFVGGAITSTKVLEESKDHVGRDVVTRVVTFKEGNREVKEVCTCFPQMKVEFLQPDGSRVMNIISDGAEGEMYMTYQFEWFLPGASEEVVEEKTKTFKKMSKMAVESSIKAIRDMVSDGRIE